jgi:hypothetical protein
MHWQPEWFRESIGVRHFKRASSLQIGILTQAPKLTSESEWAHQEDQARREMQCNVGKRTEEKETDP